MMIKDKVILIIGLSLSFCIALIILDLIFAQTEAVSIQKGR